MGNRLLALRAARVWDPSSEPIENAVVLVRDSRIVTYGPEKRIDLRGAELVDLGDVTLTPGLIDCHTHLLEDADPEFDSDDSLVLEVARHSTSDRVLTGVKNAREMLNAGITSVRDLGNSGRGGDVSLSRAIASGLVEGPRMTPATRAIAPPGAQFPTGMNPELAQALVAQEYRIASGPEEVRRAVREAYSEGARVIKVIGDARLSIFSEEELKAAVAETRQCGIRVAVHAVYPPEVTMAANAAVDSIEHAYGATAEQLATMARMQVALVPTDWTAEDDLLTASARDFARSPEATRATVLQGVQAHMARLQRAQAAKVSIAFGSDIFYRHPAKSRGTFALTTLFTYAAAGLSTQEILKTATTNAALLLGKAGQVGTLAAGAYADLIAVRGDLTRDINNLLSCEFVMQGGRVVRGPGKP